MSDDGIYDDIADPDATGWTCPTCGRCQYHIYGFCCDACGFECDPDRVRNALAARAPAAGRTEP